MKIVCSMDEQFWNIRKDVLNAITHSHILCLYVRNVLSDL